MNSFGRFIWWIKNASIAWKDSQSNVNMHALKVVEVPLKKAPAFATEVGKNGHIITLRSLKLVSETQRQS